MSGVLIDVKDDRLSVVSSDIAEKLDKKQLSPSLVSALVSDYACPARFLVKTFVMPEIDAGPLDNAATRGSAFHKVMELFFALPQGERNNDGLKDCVRQVAETDEFSELLMIEDARNWLRESLKSYFEMGSDPDRVKVAQINNGNGDKIGLEVFLKGRLGNTSRDVLGYVDRISVNPKDGLLCVEDFKTGAKAKRWNPKTKDNTGLDEQRQQLIYTMLLEQLGYNVSSARLIYPVAKEIVKVDVKDDSLRAKTIEDLENADHALTSLIYSNSFEFSPSYLCAWCPFVKMCPKAVVKPNEKMRKAAAEQPEIETFADKVSFG